MKHPILGILGGLGPASGAYFYNMIITHTAAQRDSDHIDVLLSGCASTPDRTDYIMGKSDISPLPQMRSCAKTLAGAGADLIAIPCNTAHYFYDGLTEALSVPVVNIIEQTVAYLKDLGVKRVGLLATDGTVKSGAYARVCVRAGIECVTPDPAMQAQVTDIIYGAIKAGKEPDMSAFFAVCDSLSAKGCERLILGCTELSLLKAGGALSDEVFVDSLEVLCAKCIALCGAKSTGFNHTLTEWSKR